MWAPKCSLAGQPLSYLCQQARAGLSGLSSRVQKATSRTTACAEPSPTSRRSEPTPNERRKRPRVSSTLRNAVQALILWLTLLVSGCCSADPARVDPVLPAGKPNPRETQAIAEALTALPPSEGGDVAVPKELLRRIFGHLDAWRAWALALEHAGRWSR